MGKIILYYNFIIVSIMAIAGFVQANSMAQVISAMLFFPLMLYFAQFVIPKRRKAIGIPAIELSVVPVRQEAKKTKKKTLKIQDAMDKKTPSNPDAEEVVLEEGEILNDKEKFDLDRRMFLKLIGSAGITLFFFSLFAKKAEAAFFGSVPGPGTIALKDIAGNKIDPSQHHPTDGYKITQLDDSSPAYYGFVEKGGAWFIQKEDSSGNYRYVKGSSNFSTNWTNRASLTYDYFDAIF